MLIKALNYFLITWMYTLSYHITYVSCGDKIEGECCEKIPTIDCEIGYVCHDNQCKYWTQWLLDVFLGVGGEMCIDYDWLRSQNKN